MREREREREREILKQKMTKKACTPHHSVVLAGRVEVVKALILPSFEVTGTRIDKSAVQKGVVMDHKAKETCQGMKEIESDQKMN